MTKKKIMILIIAFIVVVVLAMAYVLLLSKPQIVVKSVDVELLTIYTEPTHPDYIEGNNPVESIEYFIEQSRQHGDNSIQVFVDGDKIPSSDPGDYVKVTLNFEVTNRSVFDSYCEYIMVNDGKDLYESYLVTIPTVELYAAEGMSTTDEYKWSFYIYAKGKSTEEIKTFIKDIEFQFPFNNDLRKNSNQYFKVDDNEDVIFSFNGMQ